MNFDSVRPGFPAVSQQILKKQFQIEFVPKDHKLRGDIHDYPYRRGFFQNISDCGPFTVPDIDLLPVSKEIVYQLLGSIDLFTG